MFVIPAFFHTDHWCDVSPPCTSPLTLNLHSTPLVFHTGNTCDYPPPSHTDNKCDIPTSHNIDMCHIYPSGHTDNKCGFSLLFSTNNRFDISTQFHTNSRSDISPLSYTTRCTIPAITRRCVHTPNRGNRRRNTTCHGRALRIFSRDFSTATSTGQSHYTITKYSLANVFTIGFHMFSS